MKKAVAITVIVSLVFLVIAFFFKLPTPHRYVHATPEEVNSFIKVGMDQKSILNRFGEPQTKAPEGDGAEIWEYFVSRDDPIREYIMYGGFTVIVKDKKVTNFSLMR